MTCIASLTHEEPKADPLTDEIKTGYSRYVIVNECTETCRIVDARSIFVAHALTNREERRPKWL
jgi:hypothetical protein